MNRPLLFLALQGLLAANAFPLVFTINAEVSSDPSGAYTPGQTVHYDYVVNSSYTLPASGTSTAATSRYSTNTLSDVPIWEAISGTALTGTWSLPDDNETAPYDFVQSYYLTASTPRRVELYAGNLSGEGIGLTLNGHVVHHLFFDATFDGLDFAAQGTLADPNAYYLDYVGTYPATAQSYARLFSNVGNTYFTVNSLTIAAGNVPEPAMSGVALALILATLVTARRRR